MENKEVKEVKIVGEIEKVPLDINQHVGKRVKINEVRLEPTGSFGPYYLVFCESVEPEFELRPSRLLGLDMDKNGNYGWVREGKTWKFLQKMGVSRPEELVGKEVIVTKRENKEGIEFLTF